MALPLGIRIKLDSCQRGSIHETHLVAKVEESIRMFLVASFKKRKLFQIDADSWMVS